MPHAASSDARALAFYDLDGTLVSSNVVHQYLWYVRRQPSYSRLALLAVSSPLLKLADLFSRRLFNRIFYCQYRGLRREWLDEMAAEMFEQFLAARIYPGAAQLLAANRAEGFRNVLITGSLDFSIAPLARALGFDDVAANALEFKRGVATGRMLPPILAGREKVRAMERMCRAAGVPLSGCRAYSDDTSDLPMLEAVGHPSAANAKPGLIREAERRGWPLVDLR
ncbi:MAG: HAD family phosphatase [Bryobacteraceae bacterium]